MQIAILLVFRTVFLLPNENSLTLVLYRSFYINANDSAYGFYKGHSYKCIMVSI